MRNRPQSICVFINVPPVLKTLVIVDALGEQSERNEAWLQELSRDMASCFVSHHDAYCSVLIHMKTIPVRAGCSSLSQSGLEYQSSSHAFGHGTDSFASKFPSPHFAYEGCGFVDKPWISCYPMKCVHLDQLMGVWGSFIPHKCKLWIHMCFSKDTDVFLKAEAVAGGRRGSFLTVCYNHLHGDFKLWGEVMCSFWDAAYWGIGNIMVSWMELD